MNDSDKSNDLTGQARAEPDADSQSAQPKTLFDAVACGSSESSPLVTFCVDEYAEFAAASMRKDRAKEQLRGIDGVPDAEYLVDGDRVFVFNKLLTLANERKVLDLANASDIRTAVLDLMQYAWVSPLEAVTEWAVLPRPYLYAAELSPEGRQRWTISHSAFGSCIPVEFPTKEAVEEAVSRLLAGEVLPASGDFSYKGQAFRLTKSFDESVLPVRPSFEDLPEGEETSGGLRYRPLDLIEFEAGFDPVDISLYERVKLLGRDWASETERASRYVEGLMNDLWGIASRMSFDALKAECEPLQDDDVSDANSLKSLYPELSSFSATQLWNLMDDFQSDVIRTTNWHSQRYDEFLFYLLGVLLPERRDQSSPEESGRMVGFALLQGKSLDESLRFASKVRLYDRAVFHLGCRIHDALTFLREDKTAVAGKGRPIQTMNDFMGHSRKYSPRVITVAQSLSDFE